MILSDRDLAIAAAQAGATALRARYGVRLTHFAKSSSDFATEADLEAEQAMLDVIRAARPDDAVLGEESGYTGPGAAARTWLVDPLCGTLNYAARTTLAAVNVALRTGSGVAVAVAVADPFSQEVFWTDGGDARIRHAGRDEALVPSADSHLVDVNLDAPFPNAPAFQAVRVLAEPEFTERFRPRVLSTTLALTWVAAGRRAAYLTDGHLKDSVHFAAGIALCRAAGCVVTNLHGEPVHTGVGGLVVSADRETHDALLAIVGRQFGSN